MINQLTHLNWISICIAFVAYFMLGGLWFTLFFKGPYKKSLGRAHETLPNKPVFIWGPALCTLVITIASAMLIYALDIDSVGGAIEFTWVTGMGILVANTMNIAINPNIPRPFFYGMISGAYHLTGIFIVSMIIIAMK